jgi:hypothetical protein
VRAFSIKKFFDKDIAAEAGYLTALEIAAAFAQLHADLVAMAALRKAQGRPSLVVVVVIGASCSSLFALRVPGGLVCHLVLSSCSSSGASLLQPGLVSLRASLPRISVLEEEEADDKAFFGELIAEGFPLDHGGGCLKRRSRPALYARRTAAARTTYIGIAGLSSQDPPRAVVDDELTILFAPGCHLKPPTEAPEQGA